MPPQAQELVSPAQSERIVALAALALLAGGALWGARVLGRRGLLAGLLGPLLWLAWQGHKYLTRYDPSANYFGLDKVSVLLGEVVLFVAAGAALGWLWGRLSRRERLTAEDAEEHGGTA